MPNDVYSYWAANIHKLGFWALDSLEEVPIWAKMEQHSCNPISLLSLICAPLPFSRPLFTNNPVVSGSLKIWSQFRVHINNRQALPSAPIMANALFPPLLIDSAFQIWTRRGVGCVKDLFKNKIFVSFEQLKSFEAYR